MKSLTGVGIGVVGAAKHQQGWSPKLCEDIKDDGLSTAHATNDVNNPRMIWWVENDVVNVASNVHKGKIVTSVQRKPKPTSTNQNHLNTVWGSVAEKDIKKPKVIDDCNHGMNGVDKADQLIVHHWPNLQFSSIVSMSFAQTHKLRAH